MNDRGRALRFLAFTEAWERFSYYGMASILVLYMGQALFLPDRIGGIAGFATLRRALDVMAGPLSPVALASQVYGLYAGFVYFTPIFGGWIADRWLGRRRAVLAGAALMSAGHFAMAFDGSFLFALILLIVGCGLLKGNISAQVGALYAADDSSGRTRGFALFSMAINGGAILGPITIAWAADRLGWHVGFGMAGIMMLIGLATYAAGYTILPDDRGDRPRPEVKPAATSPQGRIIVALAATMGIATFQSIAYLQNANIGLVWIAAHVDLDVAGFRVPVGWFNAADPLASIVFVPVLFAWWRRRAQPADVEFRRIATGAAIACAANLILAAAAWRGGAVSVAWPLAYEMLLGIAFLYQWPTLLALVSRAAPARINATMLGCAFLTLFAANLVIGILGSRYEAIGPLVFWLANAGIAAVGAAFAILFRRPLTQMLA